MHHIKQYQTAITLFGVDGSVFVYESKALALKALGMSWIRCNVGRNFVEFSHTERRLLGGHWEYKPVYVERAFVMRDDFGDPVLPEDFEEARSRSRYFWLSRSYRRHTSWNGEGPVPGTRKWRGGGGYFRRFHHHNAKRQADWIQEEGEVPPRAARKARNLPDPWDDLPVRSRRDRNWKRFRKTQWKAKD